MAWAARKHHSSFLPLLEMSLLQQLQANVIYSYCLLRGHCLALGVYVSVYYTLGD
jgi:hypothetical protein